MMSSSASEEAEMDQQQSDNEDPTTTTATAIDDDNDDQLTEIFPLCYTADVKIKRNKKIGVNELMLLQHKSEIQEEADVSAQVYYNDLIMRKVTSFVSDIRDRQNLELSSGLLRYLSLRVPYISCAYDNTVMNMNFTMVEPVMTISIAGNQFNVKALTSSTRRTSPELLEAQPEGCLLKIRQIIKRFNRQTRQLNIGGISDFERRLGYIPDHQLVLSRDLCCAFEELVNVESLVLRNLCLMASVISYWASNECTFPSRIISVCFHSIWFDHAEDIDNFVLIIPRSVRRLQLSDCSGKTILNVIRRLLALGTKLEFLYIAIDYRTFRSVDQARQMLREVSEVTTKLHICACFARFISQPGFRILAHVISLLPDFSFITSMELDLGPLRRNTRIYERFFSGLPSMLRLRVLRLFGCPINYGCMDLWKLMLQSISQLTQIREFSIISLLRSIRAEELLTFCESLPPNLNTFGLHQAHHMQGNHFSIIAKRCPRLDTVYVRDLRALTSLGIMRVLMEFRLLSGIAICHSGPVTAQAYELLANREAMPHVEAAVLGGNRDQQSGAVLEALLRRLPQFRVLGTSNRWRDCEYHLWCSRRAYEKLLAAASYADCPGCSKDVSLVDEEDEIS